MRLAMLLLIHGLAATPAWAFGPAAHAYIAVRILGTADPRVPFAAALPDLNGLFHADQRENACMKHLGHYEFERLAGTGFAAGFATHNNKWGADSIAHAYFEPGAPDNYITRKLHALSEQAGITLHEAEDLFDAALDMTLARDLGPDLGNTLVASARASGPTEEDALTAAFAAPLAETSGKPLSTTQTQLRWAFRCMKSGIEAYGNLLQRDINRQMPLAAFLVARTFQWPYPDAYTRLSIALQLAADARPALDTIADDIRKQMHSNPSYSPALPAIP